MKDMFGFIIIITFIVIGFALIFLEFQREDVYGRQLYSTYQVLYGNVADDSFNVSQKLFAALILFLLNVVLLNLLISIMGDTYDKVQERRVLTDSTTRLEMILESVVYMRTFQRKEDEKKGYLIYCEPDFSELVEDAEANEWEGKIQLIKKTLKQNEQKIDSTKDEVKELITVMQQNNEEHMRHEMDTLEHRMATIMEQKMTAILEQKIKAIMEQNLTIIMEEKIANVQKKMLENHDKLLGAIQKLPSAESRVSITQSTPLAGESSVPIKGLKVTIQEPEKTEPKTEIVGKAVQPNSSEPQGTKNDLGSESMIRDDSTRKHITMDRSTTVALQRKISF